MISARWVPFEWIVALRFLQEGKVQTIFIVVGISIGVAVIVFMSALLTGLQENFIRRVLTGQSHIQVLPPKEAARLVRRDTPGLVESATLQVPLQRLKGMDQWQIIARQIQAMPEVLVVSPAATGSALVIRGDASRSISLTGITPELYYQIVPLHEKIIHGRATLDGDTIFIGSELAIDLGVVVGDKLRLSSANGVSTAIRIAAIIDLGNKAANSRIVYVTLRTAQSLLGLVGGVSVLDVTVRDVYQAEKMAKRIAVLSSMQADSWIKTNEQFFSAVNAQTTANTAIRFFVALSVGFGIASVLVVSVVQRSREIGILRAMGITRGQVLRVFLLQGGLLGLSGAITGSLVGGISLLLWQYFQRNPDGTVMFALRFDLVLLAQALVLTTLTGLMAAFTPALRAARLDPVVAIRG
jgi:lipoprotein-releasing system permease protein